MERRTFIQGVTGRNILGRLVSEVRREQSRTAGAGPDGTWTAKQLQQAREPRNGRGKRPQGRALVSQFFVSRKTVTDEQLAISSVRR